jgi:chemotaxis protein methyltransferase CheR
MSDISPKEKAAIVEICRIAQELTGVQLAERNHSMVVSRLQKRVAELGVGDFTGYLAYFHANSKSETPKIISLLTTHHTYFFREFIHFEKLANECLPALIPVIQKRKDKTLRVWAAACSRGQEVYSLAMFLDFHLRRLDPGIRFEILGTDIDSESVGIAKNAVYLREELKEVPLNLMGDHWVRGTGNISDYVKAKPSLTGKARFGVLNLCELTSASMGGQTFDLIFCRNVFIYFNREQITQVSKHLFSSLTPQGYLFLGISESLNGLGLAMEGAGPSMYRQRQPPAAVAAPKVAVASAPKPAAVRTGPIRILCVDDSPSILTLLAKIFSSEPGFQVVGTAKNGLEARTQVELLKPDALTLDIHMPEQTGIEYLEKNMKPGHPPVIMVTSVSRDDADLAGRALSLGASDYVEKPSLSNLQERGEEIRNKVRSAMLASSGPASSLSLDKSFQSQPVSFAPEGKGRIIVCNMAHREQVKALLASLPTVQPPTLLVFEGSANTAPTLAKTLQKEWGRSTQLMENCAGIKPGDLLLADIKQVEKFRQQMAGGPVSILIFGDPSQKLCAELLQFPAAHLVLQDLGAGAGAKHLKDVADDIVLPTSFGYLSQVFLGGTASRRKAG